MGFNREDELPFFKGNYVAVPGRIVRYNSSSEKLPNLKEAGLDSENVGKAGSRLDVVDSYNQEQYEPRLKNVSYDESGRTAWSGRPLIFEVKTDNTGSSADDQFELELAGDYSISVDWKDGSSVETFETGTPVIHTYASAGTYEPEFSPMFQENATVPVRFALSGDAEKVTDVLQWGDIEWATMSNAFFGCNQMKITASDEPDWSRVKDYTLAFTNCLSVDNPFPMYDVSNGENFLWAWAGCGQLTDWIGWDFTGATSLEKTWFQIEETPRIGPVNWNCTTSEKLVNIRDAFAYCNLSGNAGVMPWFETKNVVDIEGTWQLCYIRNLDAGFDFGNVTWAPAPFFGCGLMGASGEIFPDFDWSKAENMERFFNRCSNIQFAAPLDLRSMTDGTGFMEFASSFTTEHYDAILINLSTNNPNNDVAFFAGNNSKYTPGGAAETARDNLLARGWTITDGGPA